jgi:hypothetical protein
VNAVHPKDEMANERVLGGKTTTLTLDLRVGEFGDISSFVPW